MTQKSKELAAEVAAPAAEPQPPAQDASSESDVSDAVPSRAARNCQVSLAESRGDRAAGKLCAGRLRNALVWPVYELAFANLRRPSCVSQCERDEVFGDAGEAPTREEMAAVRWWKIRMWSKGF